MAESGVKTIFLNRASAIDSVIGNKDGSTSLVPLPDLARQLAGLGVEGTEEWLLAQKFAENPEDEPVLEGQFSALHHSKKSEASSLSSQEAADTSNLQAAIAAEKAGISTTQAGVATTAASEATLAAIAAGANLVTSLTGPTPANGSIELLQTGAGTQVWEVQTGAWMQIGWLGVPVFPTITAMADASGLIDGQYVDVEKGFKGKKERFIARLTGPQAALDADGALIVGAAGMGIGRLVSKRTEFSSRADFFADVRAFEAGTQLSADTLLWEATDATTAVQNAGGQSFNPIPVGGAYALDAFGEFSGALTGSRDNSALAAAVSAAAGSVLWVGLGPYDFDTNPAGLDDVHIMGAPFTKFSNKLLPLFNGVLTGNQQVALVGGVVRFYANTENLGYGYVDGETCEIQPFSGGATGATCTVAVGGGAKGVASVTAVVDGGAGYTVNQQCLLVGANGLGCQVKVTVSSGEVTAVTKVSGWYFLRDGQESHDPVLLGPVQVSGSSSIIMKVGLSDLGLDETKWTPSGFTVGPDETLAGQGVTVGASVGLTLITLRAGSGAPESANVYYNGTDWVGSNAGLYDISWVPGTNAYLQLNRKVEYTRGNTGGLKPFVPIPKIDSGGTLFHMASGSVPADGMQIKFYDVTGTRITTPNTGLNFLIIDPYLKPKSFDWGTAPPDGANFWMVGVFTKRPASYP